ncbi:MAG: hypothetical protein JNM00_04545 [Flavobacteriales bacterium]|nr:hypothetical protein [Flavobacteriales bacterium]
MPVLGSGTNPKGFFIGVDQSRALVSIPVNPAHFYSAQCAPLLRALASLLETSVWQNEKTWKEKFPKRYVGEHIQTLYFDTLDLSAVFDNDEQILKSVNPMARLAVFNDSTIAAMKSPGRAMAYRVPVFDREGHCTIHQYFSGPEGGIFYYETFPLPSGTEVRFSYGDLARFNRSTKPGK